MRRIRGLSFALALALPVLVLSACGDDDRPAECEEIVEACHEVDMGTGMIHECHESAESEWDQAQCTAMRSDCLAACEAAATADGGTADGQ